MTKKELDIHHGGLQPTPEIVKRFSKAQHELIERIQSLSPDDLECDPTLIDKLLSMALEISRWGYDPVRDSMVRELVDDDGNMVGYEPVPDEAVVKTTSTIAILLPRL
ncbi:hypothetical protein HY857_01200 [Candidatus Saccharibacteria bacterium]|nr:hypothetical protein [Candidatus Saccharibacteria bacterium]